MEFNPNRKFVAANFADGRFYLVGEGEKQELVAEYQHKDHLGNVRVAFSDRNGDKRVQLLDGEAGPSEVTQINDYFPFGLQFPKACGAVVVPENRYKYNGKEWEEAFGLYDYGARYYDPAIGRWGAVDPLADQYGGYSPYNYTLGNPIRYIDVAGLFTSSNELYNEDREKSQEETQKGRERAEIVRNAWNSGPSESLVSAINSAITSVADARAMAIIGSFDERITVEDTSPNRVVEQVYGYEKDNRVMDDGRSFKGVCLCIDGQEIIADEIIYFPGSSRQTNIITGARGPKMFSSNSFEANTIPFFEIMGTKTPSVINLGQGRSLRTDGTGHAIRGFVYFNPTNLKKLEGILDYRTKQKVIHYVNSNYSKGRREQTLSWLKQRGIL